MDDGIFFNQSKYIKEMLKKFRLEDSKPMKTPISFDTKLTKDKECESVDCTKYRGMIGTTHLGLWYPKGTDIETVVYANSDHAGHYVDCKSTRRICTFVGCCLTSWFLKKQTALAISTTEVEYVSAGKACQQALWMKQALIDYDVRLNDVPIMCDNKGAIDLSKNPMQHSRTKHIEIRHHFLRDNVQKGHISIEKVSSVDNIAGILTKPLKRESFNYPRLVLGMMEHIPKIILVCFSFFCLNSSTCSISCHDNLNTSSKAFPLPVINFPLAEEVLTTSEKSSHCQKKRDATAEKIALLLKSSSNCQSKSYDSYAKLVPHVSPCILGATKKTKKNLLKQQYGNFKAKGSDTLEQTFNRLQVIISQLQFMDVEIEQDDLNQKFLTSLAPKWLFGPSGTSGKQRVIVCYNCKGEGHVLKQYTKPKRKSDEAWFKDKVLLVQAQANV
nr:copia protein [Tanacetum cinerariifolium]